MTIFVIVVSYNGKKYIEKCIDSIFCSSVAVRIIVVDNASTDGTAEIIQGKYPNSEMIRLNKNIGFGKANNIGIKKALENGADYILLLNQDSAILPDTLEKLIGIFTLNPEFGVLSPFQFYNDSIIDGYFFEYLQPDNTPFLINDSLTGNLKEVYQTSYVNAAVWLITKKCLLKVGGFAPVFPHYGEDDNFIHRCKFHNLKSGIVPHVKAYHFRDQSITKWPIKKRIYRGYIKLLIDLMNPNQTLFKAFREIIKRFLVKSSLKSLLPNIFIFTFLILKLLPSFASVLRQRKMSKTTYAFL